jgi:hypothetical protein
VHSLFLTSFLIALSLLDLHMSQNMKNSTLRIPATLVQTHMPELAEMEAGSGNRPIAVQLVMLPGCAADMSPGSPPVRVVELRQGWLETDLKCMQVMRAFTTAATAMQCCCHVCGCFSVAGSLPAAFGCAHEQQHWRDRWHGQQLMT